MPSTTIVVACAVLLVLVVALLISRSRSKAAAATPPRFEPPRELAKRPPKEPYPPIAEAPPLMQPTKTPALAFTPSGQPPPLSVVPQDEGDEEATRIDPIPASATAQQIAAAQAAARAAAVPPAPTTPPVASDSKAPRPPLPSYSDISDESVGEAAPPRRTSESRVPPVPKPVTSEPRLPFPGKADAQRTSEPKVAAPAKVVSEPRLPVPVAKTSEPKAAVAKTSEPKAAVAKTSEPKAAVAKTSEPKAAVAKPARSEPNVPAATKPVSEPKVATGKPEEHDFSALNDAPAAKDKASAAAIAAAKYAPPVNPATADLEKNDPRHAAARRLARISVSEIKLYHEDEVKAGREAKDLWKRLAQDIALARQTFDARVVVEVRERFDYLLDELIRQLAEGDAAKLGPGAPSLEGGAAPPPPPVAPPPSPRDDLDLGADPPTKTTQKSLEAPAPKPAPPLPKPAAAAPAPARPMPAEPAKPADAAKPAGPTGIAARGLPPNPVTAQLERDDPRHAAARRLARLSVSEIKLYHEGEVSAGRQAKDLWRRLSADIGSAVQTFDKRVDKEVRERFDYIYDEILRQLAEGDVAKLGAGAPTPNAAASAAAAPTGPTAPPPEPALATAPPPEAEKPPTPLTRSVTEPMPGVVKPVAQAPEPTPAAPPASAASIVAARYAPPTNPATAELEKSDPRHAAARRLARLSVSEIKLYHEDEVKSGREAKDLWKRLTADIGLATQTYEKRVDKEVRERFDYLYDEILRQLAEGDIEKLGVGAPQPKKVDA